MDFVPDRRLHHGCAKPASRPRLHRRAPFLEAHRKIRRQEPRNERAAHRVPPALTGSHRRPVRSPHRSFNVFASRNSPPVPNIQAVAYGENETDPVVENESTRTISGREKGLRQQLRNGSQQPGHPHRPRRLQLCRIPGSSVNQDKRVRSRRSFAQNDKTVSRFHRKFRMYKWASSRNRPMRKETPI